eukprot:scaffold121930_cov30-Tisochrysis_lutea.AAC.1
MPPENITAARALWLREPPSPLHEAGGVRAPNSELTRLRTASDSRRTSSLAAAARSRCSHAGIRQASHVGKRCGAERPIDDHVCQRISVPPQGSKWTLPMPSVGSSSHAHSEPAKLWPASSSKLAATEDSRIDRHRGTLPSADTPDGDLSYSSSRRSRLRRPSGSRPYQSVELASCQKTNAYGPSMCASTCCTAPAPASAASTASVSLLCGTGSGSPPKTSPFHRRMFPWPSASGCAVRVSPRMWSTAAASHTRPSRREHLPSWSGPRRTIASRAVRGVRHSVGAPVSQTTAVRPHMRRTPAKTP